MMRHTGNQILIDRGHDRDVDDVDLVVDCHGLDSPES